jgi:hypothetical protein
MPDQMSPEEVFVILGLEWEDIDLDSIDDGAIKRQYRKLALKLHPDKNKQDPNAEARFNQLKMAHDLMMDRMKRSELVSLLKAQLQRRIERQSRDTEKQKFAEDLERKEQEYVHAQNVKDDVSRFRARHRALIEELQHRRTSSAPKGPSWSIAGPDDTNMSLDYWLNYGLNEDPQVRRSKMEKFSQFIAHKLPR